MHIRPEYHRSEYQHGRALPGRSVAGPEVTVEAEDEGTGVRLILDPIPGETFDDRDVDRSFTPDEARQLAAMLWHTAEEQDRRWR